MKKTGIIVLFLITLTIACAKKEEPPVIAKVGDRNITVEEFRNRFEFTLRLGRYPNKQEAKQRFLTSLIGEKLLAKGARNCGLDTSAKLIALNQQLEKEATIEALMEKEIASKVAISEVELREAYAKSKQELELQVLILDDAEQVEKVQQQLAAGKSFEELARSYYYKDAIATDTIPTQTLKWGQADPRIEEVAFSLESGEVSQPVPVRDQYYLLRLVNRKLEVFLTENDYQYRRPSLVKTIRRRKKEQLYETFLKEIMAGKELRVPGQVFKLVAEGLEQALNIGEEKPPQAKVGPPRPMIEKEFLRAKQNLADHLNEPFARFEDGSYWTIGQFLRNLSVGPYLLNYRSKAGFRASLRRAIFGMVELESLAKTGYRQGLQNSTYVQEQTRMWQDAFLAAEFRQALLDTVTVTAEEVADYYKKYQDKYIAQELPGKKERGVRPLEEVRKQVERDALGEKYHQVLQAYLAEAVDKHAVWINIQTLDSLEVTDINMFVLKRHFPGRPVAPAVYPLDEIASLQKKVSEAYGKR